MDEDMMHDVIHAKRTRITHRLSVTKTLMLNKSIICLFSLVAIVSSLHGAGNEVVIVYNTRSAESKSVAEYYAQRRLVPANQVFGFGLPLTETMTRAEFRNHLQKPLAKALEKKKLVRFGSEMIPATNDQPRYVVAKTTEARIRYALLCYGVPTRILPEANLNEAVPEKLLPELRRNEAAVDSELAWLPIFEQKPQLTGFMKNPAYSATNVALLHPTNGLLMVARLDGPTADIARGLVDKAIRAEMDGLWGRAYFDLRGITNSDYKLGDDWIRGASEICRRLGFETVVDENPGTFPLAFPLSQVALYAGWYDENASGPFTQPTVEFVPGAVAYHLHSFSAGTIRSTTQNWVGPLLAKGATATMGCVNEPYLMGTPDVAAFFGRILYFGFSFGEAAYAAQGQLSWQTTVIGDPLYRPFGKGLQQQHEELARRQSKLIEWSHLRVVDLNLAKGTPIAGAVGYLNEIETTKKSAVLMEKLGDLYALQGKPSSAVNAWQKALKCEPSPQQRIRLRLTLGEKLAALSLDGDAYQNYQQMLEESPDYPDKLSIYHKLLPLAQKLAKKDDAEKYQRDIDRAESK
jgi:uncharacterized protein (TIGR03790 family)